MNLLSVFSFVSATVLISSSSILIPLKDNMQATLKADLNVDEMNKQLTVYIQQEVKKGVEDSLNSLVKTIVDNKTEQAEIRLMERMKDRQMYAYFATLSKAWSNYPENTILLFDQVGLNVGNAYSGSTGRFTCQEDGIYCFSWTIMSTADEDFSTSLVINERKIADNVVDNEKTKDALTGSSTVIVSLRKGDSVGILVYDGDYVRKTWNSAPCSMFSGFKIN